MIGALLRLLTILNRLDHFIFGTGSWSLRPHEKIVVSAVTGTLPEQVRQKCEAQLNARHFVERSNARINVIRLGAPDEGLKIPDPEFEDALFKVRAKVGTKTETMNVTFYEGFLFSVETRRPGKSYVNQSISVLDVQKGKPKETLTRPIDRAEHGGDL